MKYLYLILFAAIVVVSIENVAFARDAVEASNSAKAYLMQIGVASAGIGLLIAGILYTWGFGMWGRIMLTNGAIGIAIIGLVTAILALFSKITGMSFGL